MYAKQSKAIKVHVHVHVECVAIPLYLFVHSRPSKAVRPRRSEEHLPSSRPPVSRSVAGVARKPLNPFSHSKPGTSMCTLPVCIKLCMYYAYEYA